MLWTLTKTESNLHISQNKSYISLQWHKYTFLFQKGRIAGVELSSVSVCLVGMKSWIQFLVQKQNLKGKNRRIGRINPKWDQNPAGLTQGPVALCLSSEASGGSCEFEGVQAALFLLPCQHQHTHPFSWAGCACYLHFLRRHFTFLASLTSWGFIAVMLDYG